MSPTTLMEVLLGVAAILWIIWYTVDKHLTEKGIMAMQEDLVKTSTIAYSALRELVNYREFLGQVFEVVEDVEKTIEDRGNNKIQKEVEERLLKVYMGKFSKLKKTMEDFDAKGTFDETLQFKAGKEGS